jgi:sirohydrochlorin cobaltochelatase
MKEPSNINKPIPCALVLGAHGSRAASDSNQPLYDLADTISAKGIFTAVTPAFLNGDPLMTDFLGQLPKGDVVIVPAMTSVGYYLQSVIPKQIAENPDHADYRIFISPVVGMHEKIGTLAATRIDQTMAADSMSADDTTVVLVGHGTRRNANSCKSTYALLDQLKQLRPDLKFEVAFLDQDPEAEAVAQKIDTKHTVIIPFLISRGPHTTVDIPEAFGLDAGPQVQFPNRKHFQDAAGERICVCDTPIGMYPEVADLCVELALGELEQGTPIELPTLEQLT